MEILQQLSIEQLYAVGSLILAIYEIVARYIPTEGNWSIIHQLVKVLDLLVPNKTVATTEGEKAEFTVTTVVKKEETINIEA